MLAWLLQVMMSIMRVILTEQNGRMKWNRTEWNRIEWHGATLQEYLASLSSIKLQILNGIQGNGWLDSQHPLHTKDPYESQLAI
jgi:hypothetical protein